MNKDRLTVLASVLITGCLPKDFKFDMNDLYITPKNQLTFASEPEPNRCKTVGCIAGLTVHMFGTRPEYSSTVDNEAARLLGLKKSEADNLFYPEGGLDYSKIRAVQAGKVVANLVKTGKVDWKKAGHILFMKDD